MYICVKAASYLKVTHGNEKFESDLINNKSKYERWEWKLEIVYARCVKNMYTI